MAIVALSEDDPTCVLAADQRVYGNEELWWTDTPARFWPIQSVAE